MKKITATTALAAVLLLAGCGPDTEPSAPPAPPTTSTAATQVVVGSATAKAQPISREEAGEQYLRMIESANVATERCATTLESLETGYTSEKEIMAEIRDVCSNAAEVHKRATQDLESAEWPTEAEAAIANLILQSQALQLPYTQLSKAQSVQDVWDIQWPDDTGAADIVRARLGLPLRGDK